jgi:hypothetical protein
LKVRLAVGAAPGQRVEVVSVDAADAPVAPGERGTVVSIDDHGARILFDSGDELAIDPFVVRLQPVTRLLHRHGT